MSTERIVSLQGGWRPYKTKEGLELGSVLQQKRVLFSGISINKLEIIIQALIEGIPEKNQIEFLSDISGLSFENVTLILKTLHKYEALIYTISNHEKEYGIYDRQIRFFNSFENGNNTGVDYNNNLQKRKVVIVGLGGYGSWLALLCARMGVKHIVGIDPDTVELSNLSRQVIYDKNDIGQLKVDACKKHLTKVDDDIIFEGHPKEINSPEDLIPYLDNADLIFNTFGYIPFDSEFPKHPHFIAQAAIAENVPSLTFSGSWIGPLTIPKKTPCYGCVMSNHKLSELARMSLPMMSTRFFPSFTPRIVNTASLAVWEASRFLSGISTSPVLNGILAFDTFNYEKHSVIPVEINEQCPFCQTSIQRMISV